MSKEQIFDEYLKFSKMNEEDYFGTEFDPNEYEIDDIQDELPYNVQDIRVDQKMITVFQIEHWINTDKLNLSPEYQRNLVWDNKRKSALIESLLLRIPIPAFYLDENKQGIKSVIDGMQRLSTIHEFLNNKFPLKNLQYLNKCEGMTFEQLDIKYRSRIEESTLAVNILDDRCPQMVKFDVFRRVNTGGVPLNPQEIRNIMATPETRALLKAMVTSKEFCEATFNKVKDVRMSAQELCIRYLAILFYYDYKDRDFGQYFGLLKMMDSVVLTLNRLSDSDKKRILLHFKKVMKQCQDILGSNSFMKLGNPKINKSIFTSWAVALHILNLEDSFVQNNSDQIFEKYKLQLEEGSSFFEAITSSTGTKKNVLFALHTVINILEDFV